MHNIISCTFIYTGSLTSRNRFGVKVYFFANVTGKPIGHGTWENSVINGNATSAFGNDCGAYIGSISSSAQCIS